MELLNIRGKKKNGTAYVFRMSKLRLRVTQDQIDEKSSYKLMSGNALSKRYMRSNIYGQNSSYNSLYRIVHVLQIIIIVIRIIPGHLNYLWGHAKQLVYKNTIETEGSTLGMYSKCFYYYFQYKWNI